MGAYDRALGSLMLLVAAAVFLYYTTWALILPFFHPDDPIHRYFFSREWAIRIPAFLLVIGLSTIGLFVGLVLLEERRKAERKRLAKSA